jgi:hypothetical protein
LFKGRPATKIVKIRIIVIIDKQFSVGVLALLIVEKKKRVERFVLTGIIAANKEI